MKNNLLYLLFFLVAYHTNAQETISGTLNHDGLTRNYRLYLPSAFQEGANDLPLVFNLHGLGSSALEQEFYTGMKDVAEANNFIVCHPDGIDNSWNVGFDPNSNIDDVGFIDALIDEIYQQYGFNWKKVYSTGMSNGGYMSYKLACELTDHITAIASVTGSIVPPEINSCNPSRAVPTMQIHGTSDSVVPYDGSNFAMAQEDLVAWWVNHNGCTSGEVVTDVVDMDMTDNCTAERYEYSSCNDDVKVEFYKITGGGHTWPGVAIDIPDLGPTNRDFNASETIWEFFNQFELTGTWVSSENINEAIQWNISPNPFSDYLVLDIRAMSITYIEVFNALGQRVLERFNDQDSNIVLDTQNWNKGTYILQANTEKGILTQKIIKQ